MIQPATNKNFEPTQNDREPVIKPPTANQKNEVQKQSLRQRLSQKVSEAYHSIAKVLAHPYAESTLGYVIAGIVVSVWVEYEKRSYQKQSSKDFLRFNLSNLLAQIPFLPLLSNPLTINPTPLYKRMAAKTDEFLKHQAVPSVSYLCQLEKTFLANELNKITKDWGNEKQMHFANIEWPQLQDRFMEYFTKNLFEPDDAIKKEVLLVYQQSARDKLACIKSANLAAKELYEKIFR